MTLNTTFIILDIYQVYYATIQPAAFLLVRWLYSHGSTSATELANATAMDRSSVSRLTQQLQKLGYVSREKNPQDCRRTLVDLTDLGRKKTALALKEKEHIFYERVSMLKDSELKMFIEIFDVINGNYNDSI